MLVLLHDEYTVHNNTVVIWYMLKLMLKTNLYIAIKSEDLEALDGGTSQLSSQSMVK